MATYYVDNAATGANDGTSWANAWTALPTSLPAGGGHTVYISGGSTTKTYNRSGEWIVPGGVAGNRNVFKVGLDAGHNGIAIFHYTGAGTDEFASGSYFTLSGDGGDGVKHWKFDTSWAKLTTGMLHQVRLEYLDLSDGILNCISMTGASTCDGFVMSHCHVKATNLAEGSASSGCIEFPAVTGINDYGQTAIVEYCTVELPGIFVGLNADGGNGMDGFHGGSGISIRNCIISWYSAPGYLGNQHADGWQAGGGNFLEFINNIVLNPPNYGLYLEATAGNGTTGFSDVRVWNNLIRITSVGSPSFKGGIIIGRGGPFPDNQECYMTRVIVANNSVIDFDGSGSQPIAMNGLESSPGVEDPANHTTWTDCLIVNNIVRGGSIDLTHNNSTASNNVSLSTGQAATEFTSYTQYGSSDYSPSDTSTLLLGQGADMSAYFTTDITGATRTSWDVGAYENGSGPPPDPDPGTLVFTALTVTNLQFT